MSKAFDFFMWVIVGGFFALGCAFYDMWKSRKGEDIASQSRRIIQEDIHRYEEIIAQSRRNRV